MDGGADFVAEAAGLEDRDMVALLTKCETRALHTIRWGLSRENALLTHQATDARADDQNVQRCACRGSIHWSARVGPVVDEHCSSCWGKVLTRVFLTKYQSLSGAPWTSPSSRTSVIWPPDWSMPMFRFDCLVVNGEVGEGGGFVGFHSMLTAASAPHVEELAVLT